MPLFRKRPITVEATQLEPYGPLPNNVRIERCQYQVFDHLHDTWINLEVGDWIITGPQGENYPVKKDMFEATYERVNQGD